MANLLIVDDQAGLREGISLFFEGQGHTARTASGVSEAVDRMKEEKPDLIVSDLMMKDGTGLDLRQEVKDLKLATDPYFILYTAFPTHDNATEAYQRGVDLYLTKPFQLPALALAVNQGLRQGIERSQSSAETLRRAEAFYHDFFLILNPVLPRLLMMVEGRYGALNGAQMGSVSTVMETWRKLVWTMGDFYHHLLRPEGGWVAMEAWRGQAALKRILANLEAEIVAGGFYVEISSDEGLPAAVVHVDTAEAMLEASLLRLMALSGPGATLSLHWSRSAAALTLTIKSDKASPRLGPELIRNVAILPPILPLLDESGVDVQLKDDLGPWTLSFAMAR